MPENPEDPVQLRDKYRKLLREFNFLKDEAASKGFLEIPLLTDCSNNGSFNLLNFQ